LETGVIAPLDILPKLVYTRLQPRIAAPKLTSLYFHYLFTFHTTCRFTGQVALGAIMISQGEDQMFNHLSYTDMRRGLVVMAICALPLAALIALLGSSQAQANNATQNRVTAPGGQSLIMHADNGGPTSNFQTVAAVTDVSIIDFAFEPQVVTITAGSSVRWTNNGSFIHTSTSDTGVWNSGDIAPGSMFTETFDTPGTYAYHCMHHPFMMGTIVVLSSGQPPESVSIAGASEITVSAAYAFTATVSPITTTLPITFYWQASRQTPITHTDRGLTDTVVFTWPADATGVQTITTTAASAVGSAMDTHIVIIAPQKVYLPVVIRSS
jgi:plastocyanin